MSTVEHSTFTVERTYPAEPAAVFRAWSDPEGGSEHSHGQFEAGSFAHDARYHDVVENERIVYTYEMHMDGRRISVSLASVELAPHDGGTKLKFTEHGAFLDGLDSVASREGGTASLLDKLGQQLGAH